jgi:LacI family transcriptional regulator
MGSMDADDSSTPSAVRRSAVPTIMDVAERAGVSAMTVSRVLNGGKNVRPAKIERVMEAVAELGYRRNENARSIRPGQRVGLIGVIITNVLNPYYAEVQFGVEEAVSGSGARLLVGNSGEDARRERALVDDFIGRHVDGLVVVPSGSATAGLHKAAAAGIPLVLASRRLDGLQVDTVLIDDVAGAYEGTRELLAEGHTRIGYIGATFGLFTGSRRFEGFRRAHDEEDVSLDPALIRSTPSDPEAARRGTLGLLRLDEPPTAIFSANNRSTVGVLRALMEAGVPPEGMRLVAFDDFELSNMVPYPLSVVDHDARELGRTAGRMLMDRLSGGAEDAHGPARLVELPTRLISV